MLQELRDQLPEFAKDLKLNLSRVLTASKDLSAAQIAGISLSVAYATRASALIRAMEIEAKNHLDDATIQATKAAASIMAMNNIYYRFIHLINDADYHKMPANLRMNIIANPGVDKINFELYSLAVSAINGCGLCMESHKNALQKSGVSKESIAEAIRIAAVLNGVAQVWHIENLQN